MQDEARRKFGRSLFGAAADEEFFMENMDPLGIYVIRPGVRRAALPVPPSGGLWQAWRPAEGGVMLRALDAKREPQGTLYLMEQQEFDSSFQPHDGEEESPAGRIRADAPDLFAVWYEQGAQSPLRREAGAAPSPSAGDSPWLDAFFNEDHPSGGEGESEGDDTAEAKAQEQENAMRHEFIALVPRLERGEPAAEEDLNRLIERRGPYSWKQKYMFTEFGLALRKLHLPAPALACHRKALALAPKDEHVLFNVARAEYEMGDLAAAKGHLRESLEAAPDFEAARSFLQFLTSGGAG